MKNNNHIITSISHLLNLGKATFKQVVTIAVLGCLACAGSSFAATYTVKTTADNGNDLAPVADSLRWAILQANSDPDSDTIDFDIPSGMASSGYFIIYTIGAHLPTIVETVTIDGSTQLPSTGYQGGPTVVIDGSDPSLDPLVDVSGLKIEGVGSSGTSINALNINNFEADLDDNPFIMAGILIQYDADDVSITNCYIGTDPTGSSVRQNANGILVQFGPARTVIDGNLISGAQYAPIVTIVAGSDFRIENNSVNVDASGLLFLASGGDGIFMFYGGNGSVIANNHLVCGSVDTLKTYEVHGLEVINNIFNTDVTGTQPLCPGSESVLFIDSTYLASTRIENNLVVGPAEFALLRTDFSQFVYIINNKVGTDINGEGGPEFGSPGTMGGSNWTITDFPFWGGFTYWEGNIFANVETGLDLSGGNRSIVLNNTFHDNSGKALKIVSSSFNRIEGNNIFNNGFQNGIASSGIQLINGSNGNEIVDNWIGVEMDGTPRGNTGSGIQITSVTEALQHSSQALSAGPVGTLVSGNKIAYNTGPGILVGSDHDAFIPVDEFGDPLPPFDTSFSADPMGLVDGNVRNATFMGNSIFSNGSLGIDLSLQAAIGEDRTSFEMMSVIAVTPDGVTLNDAEDEDEGGNNLQNYPVLLENSVWNPSQVVIKGDLDSEPNSKYHIEFFANHDKQVDPVSGLEYAEGESFIASIEVETDGNGHIHFTTPTMTSNLLEGSTTAFLTATATSILSEDPVTGEKTYGSTSEYSLPIEVNRVGGPPQ